MGSNGADEVMVSASGDTLCPEPTVEIKIKTLDSQTYTMQVDKCVPVPALKEQIAGVTGVLSEQQRLICRGKVLKDDQLLSAYHVEDGHTLHLVVRQPNQPPFDGPVDHSASSSAHESNQSGPGVVIGTFNINEPGGGGLPDLNRMVSAVLGSFGGSGLEGADLNEASLEDLLRNVPVYLGNPGGQQTDQTTANGPSYPAASFSVSAPLDPLQLPVIPDSLTTLSQYLTRIRTEFRENVRDRVNSSRRDDSLVSDGQDSNASERSASGGLPTAAGLAEVLLSTRQLLIHQAADSLSVLSGQLVDQENMTNILSRVATQANALGSGILLQHLGALLMELGRTTMTLRMGQTPAESVVNAGPAVFISTSGPNPIMVQPLHFQPGASFGAIPTGTGEHGLSGGSIGSGFLSRNIDIRIRTGSQREATGVQQSLGQSNQSTPDTVISSHADAPVASGIPPSVGGTQVRMIPIRTVVAALPASLRRSSTDTSRGPVRSFIPVVARVQRLSSGNLVSQRTRQSADGVRSGSLGSGQQPDSSHTLPQEGTELPGGNAYVSAGDGTQNSQGFSTDIPSSFDQLLRTVFPGEHIHISDVNLQGMGSGSATSDSRTNQGATAAAATSTQESAPVTGDGVFLSNLLRQIMPVISENTAGGSAAGGSDDTGNRDTQTSSIQGQENTDSGTGSRRRGNRPSSPASKRQRR